MSKSDKACFGLQKSNFVETMNYNEEWYTNDFSVSNYVKSKKTYVQNRNSRSRRWFNPNTHRGAEAYVVWLET